MAYNATKKNGNWNRISQTIKDWNQGCVPFIIESPNSFMYQSTRSNACRKKSKKKKDYVKYNINVDQRKPETALSLPYICPKQKNKIEKKC